jgi:uncharacterized protein (TIGR02001 family)
MKKLAVSVATLAALAAQSSLQAVSAEELSVSTTVGFESRYVFRGIQFAETSFQPAINLAYGNFYGGAWLNLPVGDDDLVVTPGGEELDLFAGYSAPLGEGLTFDVGVTYYTFPDLASGFFDLYEEDGDGLGANTIEAYAGLSLEAPLSPTLYVYRDFNFDTFTIQGGVSHSIPLSEEFSFDIGGTLGYVVDDDAGGDYLYGAATADLSYAISDDSSIAAGVRYGGSDIAGGSIIDDSIAGTFKSSGFWWGVGFSSEF